MSPARPDVFSVRAIAWLVGIGIVAFVGTLFFTLFGEDLAPVRATNPSAFAYSALGHHAFAETLRRLGVPVVVSRHESDTRAGDDGLLLIGEPWPPVFYGSKPPLRMDNARRVLLVLPKRHGVADSWRRNWLARSGLVSEDYAKEVLRAVVPKGRIVRPDDAGPWRSEAFKAKPDIDAPQLIKSKDVHPLIWTTQGILLGSVERVDGQTVWILSDPDIIANHGLGRGENGALAVAVAEALRRNGGAVVFDETVHGMAREPNLWRELFQFPLLVLTIQALAAVVILAWASMGRFGAPARPAPAGKAGTGALIDSTADMLAFGGHVGPLVGRYLDTAARHVARLLNAPRHLDEAAVTAWLERIGRARGLRPGYARLREDTLGAVNSARPDARRLLLLARRIHAWQRDMTGGPSTR